MTDVGKRFASVRCLTSLACAVSSLAVAQDTTQLKTSPFGDAKSAKLRTLEAGAKALQSNAPVTGIDIYLVRFRSTKNHPEMQMEAHHYCHQMNQDFAQCVLFDSNTKSANRIGVEYIISETIFEFLPGGGGDIGIPAMARFCSGNRWRPASRRSRKSP